MEVDFSLIQKLRARKYRTRTAGLFQIWKCPQDSLCPHYGHASILRVHGGIQTPGDWMEEVRRSRVSRSMLTRVCRNHHMHFCSFSLAQIQPDILTLLWDLETYIFSIVCLNICQTIIFLWKKRRIDTKGIFAMGVYFYKERWDKWHFFFFCFPVSSAAFHEWRVQINERIIHPSLMSLGIFVSVQDYMCKLYGWKKGWSCVYMNIPLSGLERAHL